MNIILQNLLENIDSILYMDTDTLFLTPVENVWVHFKKFNSSQMAALAPEHEDPNVGWYNRFAKHPYYGKLGRCPLIILDILNCFKFTFIEYCYKTVKK